MGQKNLPLASGEAHAKAFERCGWTRRKTGNHIILMRDGYIATLSVPNHKQVKRGTLQKLIEASEMTEEEYLACFHG